MQYYLEQHTSNFLCQLEEILERDCLAKDQCDFCPFLQIHHAGEEFGHVLRGDKTSLCRPIAGDYSPFLLHVQYVDPWMKRCFPMWHPVIVKKPAVCNPSVLEASFLKLIDSLECVFRQRVELNMPSIVGAWLVFICKRTGEGKAG